MGLALVLDQPAKRRTRGALSVYVAYTGPELACDLCGPNGTAKRAIFYDQRRKHALCAKCAVAKINARRES